MKLIYDGNWDSLIEYLTDIDALFFVRNNEIELILDTGHVFIEKEPILFKCRVITFPQERVSKDKYTKQGKVLAFNNRAAIL